jgi:hypothetical protein
MALMLVRAHPSRRSSSSAAAMMAARVAASPLMAAENGRDQMTGDVADKVWHFRDTAVSQLGARSASPIGQRACLPASAPTGCPDRYAAVSGDPAVIRSDRLVVEWRRRM